MRKLRSSGSPAFGSVVLAVGACGSAESPAAIGWRDGFDGPLPRATIGVLALVDQAGADAGSAALASLAAPGGSPWPAAGLDTGSCAEAERDGGAYVAFRNGSPTVWIDVSASTLVRSNQPSGPQYTLPLQAAPRNGALIAVADDGPSASFPTPFEIIEPASLLADLAATPIRLTWRAPTSPTLGETDGRTYIQLDLLDDSRRIVCALPDDGAATLPPEIDFSEASGRVVGTIGRVSELITAYEQHDTALYGARLMTIVRAGDAE